MFIIPREQPTKLPSSWRKKAVLNQVLNLPLELKAFKKIENFEAGRVPWLFFQDKFLMNKM